MSHFFCHKIVSNFENIIIKMSLKIKKIPSKHLRKATMLCFKQQFCFSLLLRQRPQHRTHVVCQYFQRSTVVYKVFAKTNKKYHKGISSRLQRKDMNSEIKVTLRVFLLSHRAWLNSLSALLI